jgi:hypothetical protein
MVLSCEKLSERYIIFAVYDLLTHEDNSAAFRSERRAAGSLGLRVKVQIARIVEHGHHRAQKPSSRRGLDDKGSTRLRGSRAEAHVSSYSYDLAFAVEDLLTVLHP